MLDSGELIFNENLHTNKALGDGARACNQLRALLILINISGRPPTVAILITRSCFHMGFFLGLGL